LKPVETCLSLLKPVETCTGTGFKRFLPVPVQVSTGFNRLQQVSTGLNRLQQVSTGFNRKFPV
jgi:hypothetical protein